MEKTSSAPVQHPAGWCYRLSPNLVLRTRGECQKTETPEKVLLVISGEAFPPSHPTTRLCLDLLRTALVESVDRLLDMGCGSGVLGLAGAALGVPRVVALDISRVAAQVTGENARKNNLSGPLIVVQGSSECVKATFDLVVANLPWEVQMNKVSECCRLAAHQGRLILSGFRDDRENPLLESYLKRGWSLKQRLVRDFYHPELPPHLSFTWVAWLLVGPVARRPAPSQKGSRLRLSSPSAQ